MAAFTPGPWEADLGDMGFGGNRDEPPEPGYVPYVECKIADWGGYSVLAEMQWVDHDPEAPPGVDPWAEMQANAKLMAAAPDLYEACIAMERWANDVEIGLPELVAVGLKARAAIAKAEGKSGAS